MKVHQWFVVGLVVGALAGPPVGFWVFDRFNTPKLTGLETDTARAELAMIETLKIGAQISADNNKSIVAIPAGTKLSGTYDGFSFSWGQTVTTMAHLQDETGKIKIDIPLTFRVGPCNGPTVQCPKEETCGCRAPSDTR